MMQVNEFGLTFMLFDAFKIVAENKAWVTIIPPNLQPFDLSRKGINTGMQSKAICFPFVMLIHTPNIINTCCPKYFIREMYKQRKYASRTDVRCFIPFKWPFNFHSIIITFGFELQFIYYPNLFPMAQATTIQLVTNPPPQLKYRVDPSNRHHLLPTIYRLPKHDRPPDSFPQDMYILYGDYSREGMENFLKEAGALDPYEAQGELSH